MRGQAYTRKSELSIPMRYEDSPFFTVDLKITVFIRTKEEMESFPDWHDDCQLWIKFSQTNDFIVTFQFTFGRLEKAFDWMRGDGFKKFLTYVHESMSKEGVNPKLIDLYALEILEGFPIFKPGQEHLLQEQIEAIRSTHLKKPA